MSLVLLGILNSQAAAAGGAGAYDLLETQVLTSSATSVTFTGLGSYTDYKHLQIRATLRDAYPSAGLPYSAGINAFFNGNNTGYARHRLVGNGSSVTSANISSYSVIDIDCGMPNDGAYPSGEFGGVVIDILDFSDTNKNTTLRALGGGAVTHQPEIVLTSGLWDNTSAVTSITLGSSLHQFKATSRFSLYGVR